MTEALNALTAQFDRGYDLGSIDAINQACDYMIAMIKMGAVFTEDDVEGYRSSMTRAIETADGEEDES